jgi:hypothetical protein
MSFERRFAAAAKAAMKMQSYGAAEAATFQNKLKLSQTRIHFPLLG